MSVAGYFCVPSQAETKCILEVQNQTNDIDEWNKVMYEGLLDEACTIYWFPLCHDYPLVELFSKETVV